MGGRGSGRRSSYSGKLETNDSMPLDIRKIARSGLLIPSSSFGWQWTVNDRPVGRGNRVALVGGDRIVIGGYLLEVEFAHSAPVFSTPELSAPSSDPLGLFGGVPAATQNFSDPFAGLLGTPGASAAKTPVAPPLAVSDDPFAVFAASAPSVGRSKKEAEQGAAQHAYEALAGIHFDGMQYRSDIGYRAVDLI